MPIIANVSLEAQNRLIPANNLMVKMQEHFDPFILNWQLKHPSMFRDRIPMGTLPPFMGASQESYIFRGSNSAPQAGLVGWRDVVPTSLASGTSAGTDRCSYDPQTYTWSWDKIGFAGKRREWRSPVFCVRDLYNQDAGKEQLAMIITAGSEVTDQTREVYNRETYMQLAANANKFVVLASGLGLSYLNDSRTRVTYDPTAVDDDGDTYIEFDATLLGQISTLNWTPFNQIRSYLADAAPDAGQGMDSGMPIFSLLIDLIDFEQMVFSDPNLREDMRYAEAKQLISGYNMGFKIYRGMGVVHDVRQARFGEPRLQSSTVARCKRILPRKATRPGVVGYIPETNEAYVAAELGTAVLFLNNVAKVLVPENLNNLGSGLTFGPAPGFNGQWAWVNNKDNTTNPLGEVGYFFARFEYHLKAMRYAEHAMVLLYRRCQQTLQTSCQLDEAADAVESTGLAVAPVAADFDATACAVTLQLQKKLSGVSIGTKLTVTNDAGSDFTAYVASTASAPTYSLIWLSGGTNVPTAVTEIDDTTAVVVAVA